MGRWKVRLYGIEWDDGKGEYDVSRLPKNLEVEIDASTQREAIEYAMERASDDYGSLIVGTVQIVTIVE